MFPCFYISSHLFPDSLELFTFQDWNYVGKNVAKIWFVSAYLVKPQKVFWRPSVYTPWKYQKTPWTQLLSSCWNCEERCNRQSGQFQNTIKFSVQKESRNFTYFVFLLQYCVPGFLLVIAQFWVLLKINLTSGN